MSKLVIALAAIAALTMGAVADADTRERGHRKGAHAQGHGPMHNRATPRKFQRVINNRQERQRSRIRKGWHRGQLNPHEMARLKQDQRRIRKLERRFGADGHYTRHERRILDHALDRSSKKIWRMKGNHYRGGHGYHRDHRWRRGYRGHGKRGHGHRYRKGRRHRVVEHHVYPVYQEAPSHDFGLDVETPDFRFRINKSG